MINIILVCVFLGNQGIPLHVGRASCSWKSSDTSVNKENEILESGGVNENAKKKVAVVVIVSSNCSSCSCSSLTPTSRRISSRDSRSSISISISV